MCTNLKSTNFGGQRYGEVFAFCKGLCDARSLLIEKTYFSPVSRRIPKQTLTAAILKPTWQDLKKYF